MRKNILFLCTGNSCRSQIAEAWCNNLKSDTFTAYSAGIETHGLNPYAVKVMLEAGIDISNNKSTHVNELQSINFDYVVTVCDHAQEQCPVFPGNTKVIHRSFDDPPRITKTEVNEEKRLKVYRRVRDEIKDFIINLDLE